MQAASIEASGQVKMYGMLIGYGSLVTRPSRLNLANGRSLVPVICNDPLNSCSRHN